MFREYCQRLFARFRRKDRNWTRERLISAAVVLVLIILLIITFSLYAKDTKKTKRIGHGSSASSLPERYEVVPTVAPSNGSTGGFKSSAPAPLDRGSSPPTATTSQPPSALPTIQPSSSKPTESPSAFPTNQPSTSQPTESPSLPYRQGPDEALTTFYAIGDVPYNFQQELGLRAQIQELSSDVEFLVHVGDIRTGQSSKCEWEEYEVVDEILSDSRLPVFIVPGDNEWNDCSKPDKAWKMWSHYFMDYPDRHWEGQHDFDIKRQEHRPENWSFVRNGALFIGLNLVGSPVHDSEEWSSRLSDQADWTIGLMRKHQLPTTIFGHANPNENHNDFFLPMKKFIRNELNNSFPVFHLNGDKHQ